MRLWEDKNKNSYSVDPPTTYLTFAYWIFMVPQYKPKNILIHGYGGGTTAGLIRLIYGDAPITGVDLDQCENQYNVNLIQADAKEFVKTCEEYDCVIVDLYHTDYTEPCDFVASPDFVKDLERISNYLIVNTLHSEMSAYNHLRKIGHNKASGCAEVISYYLIKGEIPNLHPYK